MAADSAPNPLSGKLVVLATLFAFAAIGVGFYFMGQYFSAHPIAPEHDTLDYADRATWEPMPTATILLEEPPRYMRGPYGSKVPKELPFTLSPAAERQLRRYSAAATLDPPVRIDEVPLERPTPEGIDHYVHWLLAHGAMLDGQGDTHREDYLLQAYQAAPAALVLQYLTPGDQPFANQPVGDIELAFARKADNVLDDSLRLLYPDNTTDALGRVYLPVFDTPLQVSVKPDPPGHAADYPFDGWLIFPGEIGSPEPITVTPLPE